MSHIEHMLSMATQYAIKSTMRGRHGCVITFHGKVVATGYNSLRNQSKDGLLKNCCSCHAEMDALRNSVKLKVVLR